MTRGPAFTPWTEPSAVPLIRFEGVSKRFGAVTAVDRVDLDIFEGEFFSLLGASGCGKTTLLRMLAGFETPTEGRILIDGREMNAVPPYERPVNMMFQSYALFPHMTVAGNIAFGLKQDGLPKTVIADRTKAVLDLVQMGGFAQRKPHQLSGGQRQRVALARALAKEPKVLLLDEPLGALDKKLREATQLELVNIQDRVGVTFVTVTHDQEEAMTMSTRIAVMNAGRIQQVGTPVEVYEYPNSRFVADFIGAANLFEGVVAQCSDGLIRVDCPELGHALAVADSRDMAEGAPVSVMVRPEKVALSPQAPTDAVNLAEGEVSDIAYLGDVSIFHVTLPSGHRIEAMQANLRHGTHRPLEKGDRAFLTFHPGNALVLDR